MTAAIWSTPPDKCALDFPALTLLRFMHNHHLLQLTGKPAWLTIPGGSHTYVKRVLSRLDAKRLHLSTPVTAISTLDTGRVQITTPTGTQEFDKVVLATHSDTALKILKSGNGLTQAEVDVLGAFGWSRNEAVLHCDEEVCRQSPRVPGSG